MKTLSIKVLSIKLLNFVYVLLLGFSSPNLLAAVEVVGLFKDRAVIRTSLGEEMVRVGQTSPKGVKLLSADANGARVSYQGHNYDLKLSNRVGSSFKPVLARSITVNADATGQYRVTGQINGSPASFLVDTGASVVAMSSKDATSLGIDYAIGQQGSVVTAQGEVPARYVTLSQVSVGGVVAHNVAATVIEGSYPLDILLGMSYLSEVAMQNQGGVLTLTER